MDVTLTGGTLRPLTFSLVGPIAEATLAELHVDKLFLATNGVDLRRGLTTPNLAEAQAKRAMIESAREVILVADHSKLGRISFCRFCPLARIIASLRMRERPSEFLRALEQRRVKVLVARGSELEGNAGEKMIATVTLNPALDKTMAIPGFAIGRTNRASIEQIDAGGKGINVAKAARQLGCPVIALGFLAGANGRWIADALEAMGIPCDFEWVPGETRVNLKIKDPLTGTETEINEPGFQVGADHVQSLMRKSRGASRAMLGHGVFRKPAAGRAAGDLCGIHPDCPESRRSDNPRYRRSRSEIRNCRWTGSHQAQPR